MLPKEPMTQEVTKPALTPTYPFPQSSHPVMTSPQKGGTTAPRANVHHALSSSGILHGSSISPLPSVLLNHHKVSPSV